jgi:hypothetical protein
VKVADEADGIRIDNTLPNANGDEVRLEERAHVQVTVEVEVSTYRCKAR